MKLLKKILAVAAFVPAIAMASGATHPLDKAPDRSTDLAALQSGAKLFVNYCLNCHSAQAMRYNRVTGHYGHVVAERARVAGVSPEAARSLAALGHASVRFDVAGIGDDPAGRYSGCQNGTGPALCGAIPKRLTPVRGWSCPKKVSKKRES